MDIRPVADAKGFRDFLSVPSRLYRNDPHYIEQLAFERKAHLGAKNPYFLHAEHTYFVAYADGQPIGRISAQIDALAQAEGAPRIGHFGLIEGRDAATLAALLAAAETWLSARDVARVQGPFSLSINDESGLLVEGFDSPPCMLMNHAPAWYGPAIEAAGYAKAKDLLAYRLDLTKPPSAFAAQMAERATAIPGLVERPLRAGRVKAEMATLLGIFNDAWSGNWGFVPITPREGDYMVANMKPLIVPELVRFVEMNGEPAGMIAGLPDVNAAIRDLRGKLLPFGWARLLWRLKIARPTTGRVLLMGVKRRFRDGVEGAAIAVLLIARLHTAAAARGIREVELSWILEDNTPVNRVIELCGARLSKRYRIYGKTLG